MKILIEIHIFSIKTDKNCKSRGSHWKSKSRCLQVGSFFDNKKHKADKVHYFQSPPVLEIDQCEQHAQKKFRRTKKFKSRRLAIYFDTDLYWSIIIQGPTKRQTFLKADFCNWDFFGWKVTSLGGKYGFVIQRLIWLS